MELFQLVWLSNIRKLKNIALSCVAIQYFVKSTVLPREKVSQNYDFIENIF